LRYLSQSGECELVDLLYRGEVKVCLIEGLLLVVYLMAFVAIIFDLLFLCVGSAKMNLPGGYRFWAAFYCFSFVGFVKLKSSQEVSKSNDVKIVSLVCGV